MHSLVKDLMTSPVVTVGPETPFKVIAAHLAEHRVSAVPVVDHDQRVLGVVSEADLLLKEEFPHPDLDIPLWWTKRSRLERAKAAASVARDLMTVAVVAIAPEATATEAARRMHSAGVKRLPVVDRGGRLVGILSRPVLRPRHRRRGRAPGPGRAAQPPAYLVRAVQGVEGVVRVESRLAYDLDDRDTDRFLALHVFDP